MTPDAPDLFVARLTTRELGTALGGAEVPVVLVPVGAIEPHGPHLPLDTDLIISRHAALIAARVLRERQLGAFVAPDAPYGVTECGRDFAGSISVPGEAVTAYLRGVADGWLRTGFTHVCLVNNHLEPAHDEAVRAAAGAFPAGKVSAASPLTRRWARTLDDEFKSGACHAGEYETSIVLAASPGDVRDAVRSALPEVDVSLSEMLARGVERFAEMGMDDAYAGAPARATASHGVEMLQRLAAMIVGEVLDARESG